MNKPRRRDPPKRTRGRRRGLVSLLGPLPKIAPFAALRYNLDHIGSLSDVIAPPYDVIDPQLQDQLYKRHLDTLLSEFCLASVSDRTNVTGILLTSLESSRRA